MTALTNEDGTIAQRYAYDPWGRRRNPENWDLPYTRTSFIINRGFTGHEHLDKFGVINMNGRVYDPLTAQFYSPDPYVQDGGNWLNYNRYSYCLNNPFKYTDPDGNWWFYVYPNITFGRNGIESIGISAGIGFNKVLSAGISIGYNFQGDSWTFTGNVGIAGASIYGGYDTKAGWIGGVGYGFGNGNNGQSAWNASSSVTSLGVGYSQNGGWNASAFGFQASRNGIDFNPTWSLSYRLEYYPKPSISEISSNYIGVVSKQYAEIWSNEQKDALLNKNGVNLDDFYVEKVEMEGLDENIKALGYTRNDNGILTNPNGKIIGGVTASPAGWNPKSSVHMSPFVSARDFVIALNHEFIHAWQWAKFGNKMSKKEWDAFKEPSAYTYTNIHIPYFQNEMRYNGTYQFYRYVWPSNLIPVSTFKF